jgi:DNA-binding MarR family transcriptional regulator
MKLPRFEPQTVAEQLLLLMMQFQRKLIRPSENITRDALSPGQFQALGMLASEGEQSMTELALALMVSKQQLTPIVDKLEKRGLVNRSSDPTDRRIIRLSLSHQGMRFLEKMKNEFVEMVDAKLVHLEEADRANLMAALRQVDSVLAKLP